MISKQISENLKNASWIRKMFVEGEKLRKERGAENVFDFSLGNPFFEPPESIKKALKTIVASDELGTHRYMDNLGYIETRKKIAEDLNKKIAPALPQIDHSHIMMSVGAAGGINAFLRTVLDKDDEVIILAPYFAEYLFYIQNNNGVPVIVNTKPDTFMPDIQAIEKAITDKTKVIIINTPNNPTGAIYPAKVLRELSSMLVKQSKPIFIVSDEPYSSIVYDNENVPCIHNIYKYSVIINSFSKSLGLAGERIGYVAINPQIEEKGELMAGLSFSNRTLGFVNCPAIWQRVIANASSETVDIKLYDERRKALLSILKDAGFETTIPKGAFYLFPKSLEKDDIAFVNKAKDFGLLLVPGTGFGYPGHVRLSYCVGLDVIEKSRDAFMELAKSYS